MEYFAKRKFVIRMFRSHTVLCHVNVWMSWSYTFVYFWINFHNSHNTNTWIYFCLARINFTSIFMWPNIITNIECSDCVKNTRCYYYYFSVLEIDIFLIVENEHKKNTCCTRVNLIHFLKWLLTFFMFVNFCQWFDRYYSW